MGEIMSVTMATYGDMSTVSDFMGVVTGTYDVVTQGIGVFATPPLSYFVALAFLVGGIGIAKKLIPKKKAR